MHLHQKTIDVLSELSRINQSILIKPGNVLTTIAPQKTHLSSVEVPDHFPQEFGIYDLGRFVKLLTLIGGRRNPKGIHLGLDFEFETEIVDDKTLSYVVISSSTMQVRYQGADPQMLVTPPKEPLQLPSMDYWFTLTREELDRILKNKSSGPIVQFRRGDNDRLVAHIGQSYAPTISIPLESDDHQFGKNDFEVTFDLNNNGIDRLPTAPFYRFEGSVQNICQVTGVDSEDGAYLLTTFLAVEEARVSRLKEAA